MTVFHLLLAIFDTLKEIIDVSTKKQLFVIKELQFISPARCICTGLHSRKCLVSLKILFFSLCKFGVRGSVLNSKTKGKFWSKLLVFLCLGDILDTYVSGFDDLSARNRCLVSLDGKVPVYRAEAEGG